MHFSILPKARRDMSARHHRTSLAFLLPALGALAIIPQTTQAQIGPTPPSGSQSNWLLVADKAAMTYKIGDLTIAAPWARATPAGAKVGGAYLKITNSGKESDRLVGGSLPVATNVEVHEMSMADNVMKMRHLNDGLEIKPGQTIELKPGGYHLMLMGLKEGLKQGQKIKGSLKFEKAGTVEVEFSVAPIGAQSGGQMSGGHKMKH